MEDGSEVAVIETPPAPPVVIGVDAGVVAPAPIDERKITNQLLALLNMSGYREIVDNAKPATVEDAFKIFLVARGLREIVSDELPLAEAISLAARVSGCEAALS